MTIRAFSVGLVCCCILTVLVGCEKEKPSAATTPVATHAAAPAPSPTVSSAPSASPPAAKTSERPSKIDPTLTTERRSAIETKYGAKGFLVAAELEKKLKADKTLKDKKSAITAFDKAARGKWVLFTGPLVNLTDEGFDVGFEYSPQLPNDPMGMSRQFFEVTLTNIEGYAKDAFKAGNVVVVLAKYNGAGKASPGHELVSANVWN